MRSKASWGYDAAYREACREGLAERVATLPYLPLVADPNGGGHFGSEIVGTPPSELEGDRSLPGMRVTF